MLNRTTYIALLIHLSVHNDLAAKRTENFLCFATTASASNLSFPISLRSSLVTHGWLLGVEFKNSATSDKIKSSAKPSNINSHAFINSNLCNALTRDSKMRGRPLPALLELLTNHEFPA
jgi:hypothetical protein